MPDQILGSLARTRTPEAPIGIGDASMCVSSVEGSGLPWPLRVFDQIKATVAGCIATLRVQPGEPYPRTT